MEKRTRFVKTEVKAEITEEAQKLTPYTNHLSLSVKVGNKPAPKDMNGYQVVTFSVYHWQPRNKPNIPFTVLIYDQELQEQAMFLKQGQSLVISGKLGYDVHNGIAKLFLFVDGIS